MIFHKARFIPGFFVQQYCKFFSKFTIGIAKVIQKQQLQAL